MATRPTSPKDFDASVAEAYATDGAAIELGVGALDGALVSEAGVRVPLSATATSRSSSSSWTRRTSCSRAPASPSSSQSPRPYG